MNSNEIVGRPAPSWSRTVSATCCSVMSESARRVRAMTVAVLPMVFEAFDYVSGRLRDRVAGLGDDENRWEPVADMWTVREQSGCWLPDPNRRVPEPAPLTTIAWRIWHVADCLAS